MQPLRRKQLRVYQTLLTKSMKGQWNLAHEVHLLNSICYCVRHIHGAQKIHFPGKLIFFKISGILGETMVHFAIVAEKCQDSVKRHFFFGGGSRNGSEFNRFCSNI